MAAIKSIFSVEKSIFSTALDIFSEAFGLFSAAQKVLLTLESLCYPLSSVFVVPKERVPETMAQKLQLKALMLWPKGHKPKPKAIFPRPKPFLPLIFLRFLRKKWFFLWKKPFFPVQDNCTSPSATEYIFWDVPGPRVPLTLHPRL